VVWDLARYAAEKLDDGVVAEMKIVCALQVYHASERDDAEDSGFVSGEAQGKLASSRVAGYYDSRGI
jgi:hypothetical protein